MFINVTLNITYMHVNKKQSVTWSKVYKELSVLVLCHLDPAVQFREAVKA